LKTSLFFFSLSAICVLVQIRKTFLLFLLFGRLPFFLCTPLSPSSQARMPLGRAFFQKSEWIQSSPSPSKAPSPHPFPQGIFIFPSRTRNSKKENGTFFPFRIRIFFFSFPLPIQNMEPSLTRLHGKFAFSRLQIDLPPSFTIQRTILDFFSRCFFVGGKTAVRKSPPPFFPLKLPLPLFFPSFMSSRSSSIQLTRVLPPPSRASPPR